MTPATVERRRPSVCVPMTRSDRPADRGRARDRQVAAHTRPADGQRLQRVAPVVQRSRHQPALLVHDLPAAQVVDLRDRRGDHGPAEVRGVELPAAGVRDHDRRPAVGDLQGAPTVDVAEGRGDLRGQPVLVRGRQLRGPGDLDPHGVAAGHVDVPGARLRGQGVVVDRVLQTQARAGRELVHQDLGGLDRVAVRCPAGVGDEVVVGEVEEVQAARHVGVEELLLGEQQPRTQRADAVLPLHGRDAEGELDHRRLARLQRRQVGAVRRHRADHGGVDRHRAVGRTPPPTRTRRRSPWCPSSCPRWWSGTSGPRRACPRCRR